METLKLSPANQALLTNKQKNNNEPKTNIVVQKNSKDTFTKTAKLTSGGVVAGGFIGALKEKLMPKNIPDSLLQHYKELEDSTVVSSDEIDSMWNKAANTFKLAINKMLDGQELTKNETEFINELGLIKQDDIKYLSDSEFVRNYIEQIVKNDSSDGNSYFAKLDIAYWTSGLHGNSLYAGASDRLEDILQGTGKYQDNDAFLDYLNSRFFGDRMYRIITDGKTGETRYAISDFCSEELKKGDILSQESYSFKEIINHAKENKKRSSDIMWVFNAEGLHAKKESTPISKLARKISEIANKEYQDEVRQLKETAIKKFKNKQLLKSAGIGAGIIGAITLVATLVCNKINKQNNN